MIRSILFSLLFFAGSLAQAQGTVGNGGVGVDCGKSIQLFDLYEGQILSSNTPVEKKTPFEEQARSFVKHLDKVSGGNASFNHGIEEVIKSLRFLPKGVALTLTEDVANFIYPKDCKLVQILNDREDGFIYVDTELWSRLSETNKAAAVLHEAIYKYLRTPNIFFGQLEDGDKNSLRTRRAVSHLIAGKKLESVTKQGDEIKSGKFWTCKNLDKKDLTTIFYAYETPGLTVIEFHMLKGATMLTNAFVTFPYSFDRITMIQPLNSIIDWDMKVLIQRWGEMTDDPPRFGIDIFHGNKRTVQELTCSSRVI